MRGFVHEFVDVSQPHKSVSNADAVQHTSSKIAVLVIESPTKQLQLLQYCLSTSLERHLAVHHLLLSLHSRI